MRAVPAPDLGQRLANNPILSSRDVAPSHPALEVVSVFNAAAATVGEETILLLRVGERPRAINGILPATARTLDPTAPEKGLQSLPLGCSARTQSVSPSWTQPQSLRAWSWP